VGRFLQTDPIGYGDGPNIYAYVGGDPVNGSDPTGTENSRKEPHKLLICINGDCTAVTVDDVVEVTGTRRPPWKVDPATRLRAAFQQSLQGFFRANIFGRGTGEANGGGGSGGGGDKKKEDEDDKNKPPTCRVERPDAYPIPKGYVGDGGRNQLIYPAGASPGSPPELNPAYSNDIANSRINWNGVFWDLTTITYLSVTGGIYSPGLTIVQGQIAVGSAGIATAGNLAHTDSCD
jgi:uncharacterized protein RhaS with RHS repeats